MTKFLLDTQVLVWALDEPHRLKLTIASLIEDRGNELYVSCLSLFEIKLKSLKGRLVYRDDLLEALSDLSIQLLPVDPSVIADFQIYNPANKDPYDNLFITMSRLLAIPFVTSDQAILDTRVKDFRTINARK